MNRVLIVGVPRSGTSWVGRVLGSTPGATYLGEPDNHEYRPWALRAKLGVPGYFYPAPAGSAADYERLWSVACGLEGGARSSPPTRMRRRISTGLLARIPHRDVLRAFQSRRRLPLLVRAATLLAVPDGPIGTGGNLVLKSVQAQLSLEWLAARFPLQVVLVFRRPLNVLSSWKQLGWVSHDAADPLAELDPAVGRDVAARIGVEELGGGEPAIARAAWLVGLLTAELQAAARRHPEWPAVWHEELCANPHEMFRDLARRAGLSWATEVDDLLDDLNRPGTGYETARVASTLPDLWRTRLTDDERHRASDVLDRFTIEEPSLPADER